MGVRILTVYAFSTENWIRPAAEIDSLMDLLMEFLRSETEELKAEGVSIRAIGDISALPGRAQGALNEAIETTAGQRRMVLNLALNYGGRDELVRAVNRWLQERGQSSSEPLTEAGLAAHLDTAGMPDPDLLIRSSGEERLSNFMLWQIAYAEIYVTKTLWPDVDQSELVRAVRAYQARARRFGAAE
jgi:undecaprenyl diphosphate synthase